jgi:hypothetical protein
MTSEPPSDDDNDVQIQVMMEPPLGGQEDERLLMRQDAVQLEKRTRRRWSVSFPFIMMEKSIKR